jgi:hypothetical protein
MDEQRLWLNGEIRFSSQGITGRHNLDHFVTLSSDHLKAFLNCAPVHFQPLAFGIGFVPRD